MDTQNARRSALKGAIAVSLLSALHVFGNFDWFEKTDWSRTDALNHSALFNRAPSRISSTNQIVGEEILQLLVKNLNGHGSLLQRTVGGAEGTRLPDGKETVAYRGHKDPMCRWNYSESCSAQITNLGSFSYQQAPEKPRTYNAEQSDRIQTEVLRLQGMELLYQANKRGLKLTVLQLLAGLDLANQSPDSACVKQPEKSILFKLAAGIDPAGSYTRHVTARFILNNCQWGYIDRLKQALDGRLPGQSAPLTGLDAIIQARKWSYFQVDKNSRRFMRWDAAGFGHSPEVIEADQTRRSTAVENALRFQIEHPELFENRHDKVK